MKKEKKYKRGDVREDGMVFWQYGKNYANNEWWVTKEKADELKAKAKQASKKNNATDKRKQWLCDYGKTAERKLRHKRYWQSEGYKTNQVKRRKTKDHKEYMKNYMNERRSTDELFKLKCNVRSNTWAAFKRNGYAKTSKTKKILGCSFDDLKRHIESKLLKGMTWENIGEWEVDHRLPLAAATTEDELIKLCHYTNLQPLWAEYNKRKGDKHDPTELKAYLAA